MTEIELKFQVPPERRERFLEHLLDLGRERDLALVFAEQPDQVAGLPKTIRLTSGEITEAMAEPLAAMVGVIKQTLEKTPPELAADIIDRGMVLSGGGSLLRNIDRLVTKETGVPAFVAEQPLACVALGAGKALENYAIMRRSLPTV